MPPTQPHGDRDFFPALESLRGIAALGVTLFHVQWSHSLKDSGLALNSWLFVDLFFVLSGFVIAHTYQAGLQTPEAAGRFAMRRFFRLYPLHLATLAGFVGLHLVFVFVLGRGPQESGFTASNEPFVQQLLAHLMLLHATGVTPTTGFNGPSWSISAEAFAYLVFALVAISPLWRTARAMTFAALAVLGLALLLAISPNDSLFSTADAGIWRALYGFAMGALAQMALAWARDALADKPGLAGGVQAAALAAALAFIICFGINSPITLIAPLVFIAPILALAAAPSGAPARWLSHPWLVGLGAISYSIYLVHFLVALVMKEVAARMPGAIDGGTAEVVLATWKGDLLVLAYGAIVIIASVITYRLIEAPARDFGRRMGQSRLRTA